MGLAAAAGGGRCTYLAASRKPKRSWNQLMVCLFCVRFPWRSTEARGAFHTSETILFKKQKNESLVVRNREDKGLGKQAHPDVAVVIPLKLVFGPCG